MKPHEEEWSPAEYGIQIKEAGEAKTIFAMWGFGDHVKARARLAAQAPAMARFIKWMYEAYDHEIFTELEEEALPILRAAGVIP